MSMASVKKAASFTLLLLRSRKFFYGIVALLVVQAAWMAFTARYPMAFDEDFHFGVIQIYSHQWSPFITSTPPDSGAYGELTRTPSYLYHYLMSFPYRLIASITNDQAIQVIALRFINIALFAGGLFAFRRLLARLKFSRGATNLSLLMMVLIPVVPFLAGQINYDNLLFLIVPLTGLTALTCGQNLATKGAAPAKQLILFLSLAMVGSLVKYAFLPIFFAALVYLVIVAVRHRHGKTMVQKTWQSFRQLQPKMQIVLMAILCLAGGLFAERYGVNVVAYGGFDPDCAKVESVEHCLQYGPWGRNYSITATNTATGNTSSPDKSTFLPDWIQGMMHRLYFAINYDYTNYLELPLPTVTAYIIGSVGIILAIIYRRSIFTNQHLLLAITIIALYTAALLYVNYSDYLRYKTMLAINGRYLIPILPLVFAFVATAYATAIQKISFVRQAIITKFALTTVMLLLTLQGGGILTYAVRSDSGWYWDNPLAQTLGNGLKNTATPFIVGAKNRQNS